MPSEKIGLVSLGCAKNLVDSEVLLGRLQAAGYTVTSREKEADVLIVNTCAFILPAVKESLRNIFELARLKQNGKCRRLLVAGCLTLRYGRRLFTELPEVDGFLGAGADPGAAEAVKRVLAGERIYAVDRPSRREPDGPLPRLLATPPYTAYVKIAEGCSNRCSFCTIPAIRGRYRSRTIASIAEEVNSLAQKGVQEIILIAQDTSRYGMDRPGAGRLPELIRRLDAVFGLRWLRLLYCSPDYFPEELIPVLASSPKCCRCLDIPIQHASNEILKKMNRRKTIEEIRALIRRLRAAVPGLELRTTFLVGFPGESETHFAELLDFAREISFDYAGVFKFYPEEGTPAAGLPGQVPEEVKEERYHRLMALQQEISLRQNRQKVGKKLTVLVEGKAGRLFYGRAETAAPEVDGKVYFAAERPVSPGEFVPVLIQKAKAYDLIGELADEPA